MGTNPITRIKVAVRGIVRAEPAERRALAREILMACEDLANGTAGQRARDDEMSRRVREAIAAHPEKGMYGETGIQAIVGCTKGFIERELRRMKREGLETRGYYAGEKQGLYAGGRKS